MHNSEMRHLLTDVSEKVFQAQVIEVARLTGWLCYHSWTSIHSEPGYPDLTLVRPDGSGLIFAELKTERGRITASQSRWLDALRANGVAAPVWRPHDIDEILERLNNANRNATR